MMNIFPATFEQLQTSLEFELTGISNGILNKMIKHCLKKMISLITGSYCSMTLGCYKSPPLQEISSRDLSGSVKGKELVTKF